LLGQSDKTARESNQPVEPFRVVGNVYYVGANEITAFLVTTPKGHVLVNAGFVETVSIIESSIRKLGFRVEDIRYLLVGQAHSDHAGGLAQLKARTSAKLIASDGDAPLLERGGRDDPQFGSRFLFPPVRPDRIVRDGDRIVLGGTELVALITPGHTPGCTTWTMRTRENGRDFDVVFVGGATAPGYRLLDNPRYPNAEGDFARTFDLLEKLPCDVFLGAHGSYFDLESKRERLSRKGPNPFVDSGALRRYAAAIREDHTRQVARERASGAN